MKRAVSLFVNFEKWCNNLGALVIGGMMLLVTANVISRYIFNRPILGVLEFTEFMIVAVVYLTLSYTQRQKGHIDIELVTAHLPEAKRQVCQLVTLLCGLGFFGFIAWQGIVMTLDSYHIQEVTFGTVEVLEWPFKAVVPFGSILITIRFLIEVVETLQHLIRGKQ